LIRGSHGEGKTKDKDRSEGKTKDKDRSEGKTKNKDHDEGKIKDKDHGTVKNLCHPRDNIPPQQYFLIIASFITPEQPIRHFDIK
jgi:hypothetical protein